MAHQLTDDELSIFVPERLQVDWQESRTHPHCKWDADAVVDFLREVALCRAQLREAQEERDKADRTAIYWQEEGQKAADERDAALKWKLVAQMYVAIGIVVNIRLRAERNAAILRGAAAWEVGANLGQGAIVALDWFMEARKRAEAAERELEAQRALAEALAELKEHPLSCGCVAKQGGLIYTTVCARHREQGHAVGRRFGDDPAEALRARSPQSGQEEGDDAGH